MSRYHQRALRACVYRAWEPFPDEEGPAWTGDLGYGHFGVYGTEQRLGYFDTQQAALAVACTYLAVLGCGECRWHKHRGPGESKWQIVIRELCSAHGGPE